MQLVYEKLKRKQFDQGATFEYGTGTFTAHDIKKQ